MYWPEKEKLQSKSMNKLSIFICFIGLFFGINKANAQSKLKVNEFKSHQYEIFELEYSVQKPNENIQNQEVVVQFLHENGTHKTVKAFRNFDKLIVRFCPELEGTYRFNTLSNYPSFLQQKGILQVEKALKTNFGAVKIHPKNPQKFTYQNGKSYFPLAFECDWLWALDYGRPNLNRTDSLLNTIAKNGFNQVVMNVYAYDVGWKVDENVPVQYEFKRPTYSVFEGTNEKPNHQKLNYAFFEHYDKVLALLQKKGIVAHMMIYVWNKKVNWPSMYSVEDNQYFDYVIARYQAYSNVIWDVSKEALDYGRCDIPYINERIERIRKNDLYNRLVTVHDYEYCSREPIKVDFISIQNWRSELNSLSLAALQKHADKPVYNIEHGGYEEGPYLSFQGNYINAEACLQRNYECAFAGVYTSYYWQDAAWNIVVWDLENSTSPSPKPKLNYYKYFFDFFQKYPFEQFSPCIPKLTTNGRVGADNLASSGLAMSNGRGTYIYYVTANNFQINVVLPENTSKKVKATWFNPFTGHYLEKEKEDIWVWKGFQSPWPNVPSILIINNE